MFDLILPLVSRSILHTLNVSRLSVDGNQIYQLIRPLLIIQPFSHQLCARACTKTFPMIVNAGLLNREAFWERKIEYSHERETQRIDHTVKPEGMALKFSHRVPPSHLRRQSAVTP